MHDLPHYDRADYLLAMPLLQVELRQADMLKTLRLYSADRNEMYGEFLDLLQ